MRLYNLYLFCLLSINPGVTIESQTNYFQRGIKAINHVLNVSRILRPIIILSQ